MKCINIYLEKCFAAFIFKKKVKVDKPTYTSFSRFIQIYIDTII